jgi:glycosyltransferase involved in cell wall biosynthesis
MILPPPTAERDGWPWQRRETLSGQLFESPGHKPRISIITPSFNQAHFLEQTIRSVLLQGYPNLEYIIIDGGSTDGSVDIILKYAPWLAFWVSEPDEGQGDAINKGLNKCTGDIIGWLNSDDYYHPGVLERISQVFRADPALGLVFGDIQVIDPSGEVSGPIGYRHRPDRMLSCLEIPFQPASFFSSLLVQQIGPLDTSLHYVMDVDILLRAMANAPFMSLPLPLAFFRIHENSKTFQAEADFGTELLTLRRYVLNHLNFYPGLKRYKMKDISSNFFRLASKHFYLAGLFSRSARCLCAACYDAPQSALSILSDEGIKWAANLFLPTALYRRISHFLRSRSRKSCP